jgi:inorganic pyrophosphatase/exopolyphosphatase
LSSRNTVFIEQHDPIFLRTAEKPMRKATGREVFFMVSTDTGTQSLDMVFGHRKYRVQNQLKATLVVKGKAIDSVF